MPVADEKSHQRRYDPEFDDPSLTDKKKGDASAAFGVPPVSAAEARVIEAQVKAADAMVQAAAAQLKADKAKVEADKAQALMDEIKKADSEATVAEAKAIDARRRVTRLVSTVGSSSSRIDFVSRKDLLPFLPACLILLAFLVAIVGVVTSEWRKSTDNRNVPVSESSR